MIKKIVIGLGVLIFAIGFQSVEASLKTDRDIPERIVKAEKETSSVAFRGLQRYRQLERHEEEKESSEREGTVFQQGSEKEDEKEIKSKEKEVEKERKKEKNY